MSTRPQQPDGSLTIHLQRVSHLEYHCSQWTYLWTTANGSGPQWHASWGCNSHHLDSTLYASPTSTSHRHPWSFWWCHCNYQPAAHKCHRALTIGFLPHPSLHFPAQHAKATATICSFGGSVSSWRVRRFPPAQRDGHCHLCPNGNIHTNDPNHDADTSTSAHSHWWPELHPYHILEHSSQLCKRHCKWWVSLLSHDLRPLPREDQQIFPDKLLQLQEKMNVALEQLLTNRTTMGLWHSFTL